MSNFFSLNDKFECPLGLQVRFLISASPVHFSFQLIGLLILLIHGSGLDVVECRDSLIDEKQEWLLSLHLKGRPALDRA